MDWFLILFKKGGAKYLNMLCITQNGISVIRSSWLNRFCIGTAWLVFFLVDFIIRGIRTKRFKESWPKFMNNSLYR